MRSIWDDDLSEDPAVNKTRQSLIEYQGGGVDLEEVQWQRFLGVSYAFLIATWLI